MNNSGSPQKNSTFGSNPLSTSIQIGLVFLMAWWCLQIVAPFVGIIAWAAIMAVAVFPIHRKLTLALGGREKLSALIIVLVGLSIIIIPAVILAESSIEAASSLASGLDQGTLTIPPPQENVASWPIIGERLFTFWSEAAINLEATLRAHSDQVKAFSQWLLKSIASTTFGLLGFVLSTIIAGVLMLGADKSYRATRNIGKRLAGEKGADFTDLTVATIRSVAKGVLGVAVIQTLLAAVGLVVMGVPAAGLFAAIILVLAIVQLPPLLVLGPIAVWVFSTADPIPATIFAVYCGLVSFSDGLLKPLFLGRGVAVPMLVILLGAIGGMMAYGIIGLFVGAVILALGYELFQFWLVNDQDEISE